MHPKACPDLLHGLLAKIFSGIAAHPAGAGSKMIGVFRGIFTPGKKFSSATLLFDQFCSTPGSDRGLQHPIITRIVTICYMPHFQCSWNDNRKRIGTRADITEHFMIIRV
jgi:hypothetical protein